MTTWDPNSAGTGISLSNDNLTVQTTVNNDDTQVIATEGKDSGKWYWEIEIVDSYWPTIGIQDGNGDLDEIVANYDPGAVAYSICSNANFYAYDYSGYRAGSISFFSGTKIVQCMLDLDNC